MKKSAENKKNKNKNKSTGEEEDEAKVRGGGRVKSSVTLTFTRQMRLQKGAQCAQILNALNVPNVFDVFNVLNVLLRVPGLFDSIRDPPSTMKEFDAPSIRLLDAACDIQCAMCNVESAVFNSSSSVSSVGGSSSGSRRSSQYFLLTHSLFSSRFESSSVLGFSYASYAKLPCIRTVCLASLSVLMMMSSDPCQIK